MKIGIPNPITYSQHINPGIYDLFKKLQEYAGESVEVSVVDGDRGLYSWQVSEDLDVFVAFGWGIDKDAVQSRNTNTKFITIWDDIHYRDKPGLNNRRNLFSNADHLLLGGYPMFLQMPEYADFHDKCSWFPWWVTDELISFGAKKKFETKEDNILLSGRISDSYPVRQFLNYAHRENPLLKIHHHPGYGIDHNENKTHELYYSALNNSKYCLQINAKEPLHIYHLAKLFEIPASGSLMIANPIPRMEDLGFIHKENCILIEEQKFIDDFESVIEEIFSISEPEEIAKRGFELVSSRHTTEKRVEQIITKCLEIKK